MQTFYDLLTIAIVFGLAGAMLYLPCWLIGRIRDRIGAKRILKGLGYTNLRVGLGIRGDGIPVAYMDSGTAKQAFVYAKSGFYFLATPDGDKLTHLITRRPDGSIESHELPDKNLIGGKVLHYCCKKNNSIGVSLFWAILALIATPVILKWPLENFVFVWINNLAGSVGRSPIMLKAVQVLYFAVALLFFVLIPMLLSVYVYRRLRYEKIFSWYPICKNCAYDLRGNVSANCPECGEVIESKVVVNDD
ncbi:MAG TPA: hypothetical protein PKN33_20065 [Phycisphaerae bacterium]|nr:hypothetical protein [Phycisphaerae bacterium]